MPVVITSVNGIPPYTTGTGGTQVPATLHVTGTFTGCTHIWVGSSCTTPPTGAPGYPATLTGSTWSCDLPNDKTCACGSSITVTAQCDKSQPVSKGFEHFLCDNCPTASNPSVSVDPNCFLDQGVLKRNVNLSVTVINPTTAFADAQWIVNEQLGGGVLGPNIYGPTFGAAASSTSPPASQVPPGPQTLALVPGNYQATLTFLAPYQNCPGIQFNFGVKPCPTTTTSTTTTAPPQCPTVTQITFTEGPCDPTGARQLTATAQVQGGVPSSFYWQWDTSSQSHVGGSSDSQTFPGGTTHTVHLVISGPGQCFQQASPATYTLSPCTGTTTTSTTTTGPTTTTTPSPTTTTSTTSGPTTTVGPTTSTSTPPPSTTSGPSSGGFGCFCSLLVALAMLLIGTAAITLLAWACGSFLSAGLMTIAITTGVLGCIVLVIWIVLCRNCPAITVLLKTFSALMVGLLIGAAILFFLGVGGCAIGLLIDWAFFGLVVLLLSRVGKAVGC